MFNNNVIIGQLMIFMYKQTLCSGEEGKGMERGHQENKKGKEIKGRIKRGRIVHDCQMRREAMVKE